MWVVNRQKERERTYLSNEVSGLIQRLQSVRNEARALLVEARYVLEGSTSCMGNNALTHCQEFESVLGRVESTLSSCSEAVRSIDVMEWVSDDER